MSRYTDLIKQSGPDLYWPLGDTSGTVVVDQSGNGHDGNIHSGQILSTADVTQGAPGGTVGTDKALQINAEWTFGPLTQTAPGTGVKADSYNPFAPGAQVTLECWAYKVDPISFATMFSASGYSPTYPHAPHPTLEWGMTEPLGTGHQYVRWYATVNTFPAGFIDWGNINAGWVGTVGDTSRNEFQPNRWEHIAFTFDDVTSLANLYVNGRSQGVLGPLAFPGLLATTMHFDTVTPAAGEFQIGWRGGAPQFPDPGNTEVWGGSLQHVAVYERILPEREVVDHWRRGQVSPLRRDLADRNDEAESIDRALSRYFSTDVT